MFKTETHLHISEVSPCARLSAEEMIKLYAEAGYSTVFVSDHFKAKQPAAMGDDPEKAKTDLFLGGFRIAQKAGEKYGVNVLLSAEIQLEGSPNHYLVYGVTEEFFYMYPYLCRMSLAQFYETAKKHGILVIQAHPHRDGVCTPTPEYVDGFEVYNSNPRHEDYSDKTEALAKKHALYMSAGSDAHRTEDVAGSGVLSEKEIKTSADFIELIKSGKAEFIKR